MISSANEENDENINYFSLRGSDAARGSSKCSSRELSKKIQNFVTSLDGDIATGCWLEVSRTGGSSGYSEVLFLGQETGENFLRCRTVKERFYPDSAQVKYRCVEAK